MLESDNYHGKEKVVQGQKDEVIVLNSGQLIYRAFLVGQMVKKPPVMQEICVQSLDWEDPLEKGMATHSSILGWRIPGTEEPGGLYSPWGHKEYYQGGIGKILE